MMNEYQLLLDSREPEKQGELKKAVNHLLRLVAERIVFENGRFKFSFHTQSNGDESPDDIVKAERKELTSFVEKALVYNDPALNNALQILVNKFGSDATKQALEEVLASAEEDNVGISKSPKIRDLVRKALSKQEEFVDDYINGQDPEQVVSRISRHIMIEYLSQQRSLEYGEYEDLNSVRKAVMEVVECELEKRWEIRGLASRIASDVDLKSLGLLWLFQPDGDIAGWLVQEDHVQEIAKKLSAFAQVVKKMIDGEFAFDSITQDLNNSLTENLIFTSFRRIIKEKLNAIVSLSESEVSLSESDDSLMIDSLEQIGLIALTHQFATHLRQVIGLKNNEESRRMHLLVSPPPNIYSTLEKFFLGQPITFVDNTGRLNKSRTNTTKWVVGIATLAVECWLRETFPKPFLQSDSDGFLKKLDDAVCAKYDGQTFQIQTGNLPCIPLKFGRMDNFYGFYLPFNGNDITPEFFIAIGYVSP